ncbi:uncharacterized protein LOC142337092 isoform X2 [Convolutriloba macropyga]|uniref:uncharacterized protein LOC142337092 isoform X2 n=1 Tax=Convolutriloba macropyga TaxID=536237 RepID=UPI003F521ACB
MEKQKRAEKPKSKQQRKQQRKQTRQQEQMPKGKIDPIQLKSSDGVVVVNWYRQPLEPFHTPGPGNTMYPMPEPVNPSSLFRVNEESDSDSDDDAQYYEADHDFYYDTRPDPPMKTPKLNLMAHPEFASEARNTGSLKRLLETGLEPLDDSPFDPSSVPRVPAVNYPPVIYRPVPESNDRGGHASNQRHVPSRVPTAAASNVFVPTSQRRYQNQTGFGNQNEINAQSSGITTRERPPNLSMRGLTHQFGQQSLSSSTAQSEINNEAIGRNYAANNISDINITPTNRNANPISGRIQTPPNRNGSLKFTSAPLEISIDNSPGGYATPTNSPIRMRHPNQYPRGQSTSNFSSSEPTYGGADDYQF